MPPLMPRFPTLKLRHLLQLVASGHANPQAILEKSFQWEHERRMELAKWLLAFSTALVAAVVAATLTRGFRVRALFLNLPYSYWLMAAAGVFAMAGVIIFLRAQVLHRRYVLISALVCELMDIQPFLRRMAREEVL